MLILFFGGNTGAHAAFGIDRVALPALAALATLASLTNFPTSPALALLLVWKVMLVQMTLWVC